MYHIRYRPATFVANIRTTTGKFKGLESLENWLEIYFLVESILWRLPDVKQLWKAFQVNKKALASFLAKAFPSEIRVLLRGKDLNLRPLGYEPNELPDCSTPRADTNKRSFAKSRQPMGSSDEKERKRLRKNPQGCQG